MAAKGGDPPDQHLLDGVAERLDLSPARMAAFLVEEHKVPKDIARKIAADYALKPRDGKTKKTAPLKRSPTHTPNSTPKDVVKFPSTNANVVEEKSETEGGFEAALLSARGISLLPIRAWGRHAWSWRAMSAKWWVLIVLVAIGSLGGLTVRLDMVPLSWLRYAALVAPPVEATSPISSQVPSAPTVPPTPTTTPDAAAANDGGWETRTILGDGVGPNEPSAR